MKWVSIRLLAVAVVLGFCATAWSQTAVLWLDPPEATINPGQSVTFEVFIDDVQEMLRGYQTQINVGVVSGTLGAPCDPPVPAPPGDPAFGWCHFTLDIDQSHPDWVFQDPGLGTFFPSTVPAFLRLVGVLMDASAGVIVTTPKYIGTYEFQAPLDALGTFTLDFDPNDTFLRQSGGGTDPIPILSLTGATITITVAPPNDDCIDRSVITDGVTPFGTDFGTVDGPVPPPACEGGSIFGPDIWFEYAAPCTGPLAISTCGDADFDTRLVVYSDGSGTCACPVDNSTLLACSDDAAGCSGFTSEVVLSATTGTCYTIRLGSPSAQESGTGNLTVVCIGNDDCSTAELLTVPSTALGSTRNANIDSGVPSCGPPLDSPGVWYRMLGTGDHLMSASLCGGASFDTRLTVYEGASCGALTCVVNANDTCGSQEELSWCTQAGQQYWILVSGVGGATGSFTLDVTVDTCNDGDACTDDSCSAAVCEHVDNYDVANECCNPATGVAIPIEDANPCTFGQCNPATGQVTQIPIPDGPDPGCFDDLDCTQDECLSGVCTLTDINTIPCQDNTECPGEIACDPGAGLCVCVEAPTLTLVVEPGSLPVDTCFAIGETVTVRIEMGFSPQPIVSGQFFLEYDPTTLSFVDMVAGGTVDPGSPFNAELGQVVNPVAGTIMYGVGVPPGGSGTVEPALMAVMTFQAVAECTAFVRFQPGGRTLLFDQDLNDYEPIIDEPQVLLGINASPPVLSACPADVTTNPDPGLLTAVVTWTVPTAVDSCDGAVPVSCNPPSGSAFSVGTTTVTCSALNSCEVGASCTFGVTVVPSTLTVDIELAPIIMPGPIVRCITFEVHDCVAGIQVAVPFDVTFFSGQALSVVVPVPTGTWDCVTARDTLHTLRSTAADLTTPDGIDYTATFTGGRPLGGHQLVGGDLNDDGWVDTMDYAIFLSQYLQPMDPNTTCPTTGPHGDINGDGVVSVADLGHIQLFMFQQDEPNCCGLGGLMGPGPIKQISIPELYTRGLRRLQFGDMNKNGKLDQQDIAAFIEAHGSAEPKRPAIRRPR